jgi:hypothetical protein
MYLVARIIKDILSGKNGENYLGWVFRFSQQILGAPSTEQGLDLAGRLGGLHDVRILCLLICLGNDMITYS